MFGALGGLSSLLSGGSSALGGVFGIGEKLFDNYASAKAATKAFDREQWIMGNRYQLQVKDMIKAGLNPMLAAGASPGTPSAPVAQVDRGGAVRGISAVSSAKQADAATVNLLADAKLKNAQAETELRRPANVEADTALKGAEISAAQSLSALRSVEYNKALAEIENIKEVTRQVISARNLNEAHEALARADTMLRGLDYAQKEKLFPDIRKIVEYEMLQKSNSMPASWNMRQFAESQFGTWLQSVLGIGGGKEAASAAGAASFIGRK